MKTKDLLNKLPASWNELTIADFKKLNPIIEKLIKNEDINAVDIHIEILSTLLDVTPIEIESLPIADVIELSKKIAFVNETPIAKGKTSFRWKDVTDITYSEYILFMNLKGSILDNTDNFIKYFAKDKLTTEEINQMSVQELINGFFLFNRMLTKSVKSSIWQTKLKLMKQKMILKKDRLKANLQSLLKTTK